jgi:hypothetical protein
MNIPAKIFDKYIPYVNITGWVCYKCRESAPTVFSRLDAPISCLTEEMAEMKVEIAAMKTRMDCS